MQLLSPTKSEEITAVSPSFCDLFTFKALGKKKKKKRAPYQLIVW